MGTAAEGMEGAGWPRSIQVLQLPRTPHSSSGEQPQGRLGRAGQCRRLTCSLFAAAHLHGELLKILSASPGVTLPGESGLRLPQRCLLMPVGDGGPRSMLCEGASRGMILGERVMIIAGLGPRGHSKSVFLIFFDFPAQALTLGTADETPRRKPCPWTPPAWRRAVPRSPCLQPLPAGSGLSSASGFAAAGSPGLSTCHQEVTSSKPLGCCWPWRPRGGFWDRFPSGATVHHPRSPRAGPSLPALPSPASPLPAGWPQHCRVGRPGCGCTEAMLRGKCSARARRAWSFLRAMCQPSIPNPGGKKTPTANRYFSPLHQPGGRIRLPGGIQWPRWPLPTADGCALVSPMAAPQRCLRGSELTREDGLK